MRKENIDISAPIIPGESIGGIPLYSHIRDYRDLVSSFSFIDVVSGHELSSSFYGTYEIGYEYRDTLTLVFNVINGKLLKSIAWNGYQGLLFGKIRVGMNIKEAKKLDSRIYQDFDEKLFLVKGERGVCLDVDLLSGNIKAITVYVKEIDDVSSDFELMKKFEEGSW